MAQMLVPLNEADERSGEAAELLRNGVVKGVSEVSKRGARKETDGVTGGPRGSWCLTGIDRNV